MLALVVALVFAFVALAVAAYRAVLGLERSCREVIVVSATIVAAFVAITTEVLSFAQTFALQPVLIAWASLGVFALAWAIKGRKNISEWSFDRVRPALLEIVPLLAVLLTLGVTLTLAILCPPNNWDVILYHLPRQMQWIQQASVAHFPTQDYRLTVNPPLMEFIASQLMLLGETDRLNSLVSWSAFALTLTAVSLLARELGVSRLGQWIAAAFAATIPIAIHEAASGKNDGLVAFWFVTAAFWFFRISKQGVTTANAMMLGTTLGLLALTKGTGAIFAAPIVLLALFRVRRSNWLTCASAAAIAIALNAPHLLRNHSAYGSYAGQTFGLGNEHHTFPVVVSNALRNLAMHAALPSPSWNAKVEKWIRTQHRGLKLDAADRTTTWAVTAFTLDYAPHKEHATAPLHLLLAIIASLAMLRSQWRVGFILLGGLLLFCLAFKWQPWHPRLHLPLLSLAAVSVGWLLSQSYLRTLSPLVVASLLGASLPSLFASEYRSLTGSKGLNVWRNNSDTLRCLGQTEVQEAIASVVERVGNRHVDLVNQGALPWEYPLTRSLKLAHNPRHVGYFYPVAGSPPKQPAEVVIDIGDHPGPSQMRHASGAVYIRVAVIGPFSLYEPGTAIPGEVLDHAVGRFGIGAEPPPFHR